MGDTLVLCDIKPIFRLKTMILKLITCVLAHICVANVVLFMLWVRNMIQGCDYHSLYTKDLDMTILQFPHFISKERYK